MFLVPQAQAPAPPASLWRRLLNFLNFRARLTTWVLGRLGTITPRTVASGQLEPQYLADLTVAARLTGNRDVLALLTEVARLQACLQSVYLSRSEDQKRIKQLTVSGGR